MRMKDRKTKVKNKTGSGDSELMPGKTIRTTSGGIVKQYPAKVGYHGTQDENKLNPEE